MKKQISPVIMVPWRANSSLTIHLSVILGTLTSRCANVSCALCYSVLLTLSLTLTLSTSAQVAVNTTGEAPNTSSMLDVSSTSKGILIPRMTQAQRNEISNIATGLLVYQTDNTPGFYFYNGGNWVVVGCEAISLGNLSDASSDGSSLFAGYQSGHTDDGTSNKNTGFGIQSMLNVTSGYENSSFGREALKSITSGSWNTSFGIHSLYSLQIGNGNTAIGTNAGYTCTGSSNVFIGGNAGYNAGAVDNKLYIENSTSSTPLIYGEFDNDLLRINGTLDINNAYQLPTSDGTSGQTLKTNGSGSLTWSDDTNTGATSINELSDAATDNNSLFIGVDAGGNDDGTTNFNTGTGVWSLKEVTSGSHNSAMGTTTLQNLTTGSQNTGFGMGALNSVTTNSNNTAIGKEAGKDVTGSGNVFIGNEAAKTQTSISNKLFIDNSSTSTPLIYGDFSTDLLRVNGTLDISNAYQFPTSDGTIGQTLKTDGNGSLVWSSDVGATSLNDLSDAKTTGYSVFVGGSAGQNDDGTDNYNVSVGISTLYSNTSGDRNIAIGTSALFSNTSGSYNTASGFNALYMNTSGYENTATGNAALYSNTTGFKNTATGSAALYNNSVGARNTATGYLALSSNTSGNDNTANGSQALSYNSAGYNNTATGSLALAANSTGGRNTALGAAALRTSSTGSDNTAVGNEALYSTNTGYNNTAIGSYALYNNTTGRHNTAAGFEALHSNTTSYFNTAVGVEALKSNTGNDNTAIGFRALFYNVEGNANTAVGWKSGSISGCANLYNSGTFGYNTQVLNSHQYRIGNTSVNSIGGQVSWSTYSDGRFKRNVQQNVPGLEFILKLNPVSYNWDIHKLDDFIGATEGTEKSEYMREARRQQEAKTYTGFVAQDVEKAAKDVGYDFSGVEIPPNDGTPYSIRYAEFVVPLVKGMQEQQEMIEAQQQMIEELRKEIELLKGK